MFSYRGTSRIRRLEESPAAAICAPAALDWTRNTLADVDLSVVLEPPPAGNWLAMDARTHVGDRGAGTCVGVLSEGRGRIGVSTQALFIEAR